MTGISFCVSLKNRHWQLEQVLHHNLAAITAEDEICIADFGSDDGALEWIKTTCADELACGKLRLFEARNERFWSSPTAKNLAHRLATKDYLFNLDADNFVSGPDLERIGRHASKQQPCHQWSGTHGDGSFGRIGLPRGLFTELRGYDDALLPMGRQDVNILERLKLLGHPAKKLGAPAQNAIPNKFSDKVQQVRRDRDFHEKQRRPVGAVVSSRFRSFIGVKSLTEHYTKASDMDTLNAQISKARINLFGPVRPNEFLTHVGYLNGMPIKIDGHNIITALADADVQNGRDQ
ncbi:MAG: glycosyltransferase family A protein [Pseudomonadota bacterium]